jgi:hypothetical protein
MISPRRGNGQQLQPPCRSEKKVPAMDPLAIAGVLLGIPWALAIAGVVLQWACFLTNAEVPGFLKACGVSLVLGIAGSGAGLVGWLLLNFVPGEFLGLPFLVGFALVLSILMPAGLCVPLLHLSFGKSVKVALVQAFFYVAIAGLFIAIIAAMYFLLGLQR